MTHDKCDRCRNIATRGEHVRSKTGWDSRSFCDEHAQNGRNPAAIQPGCASETKKPNRMFDNFDATTGQPDIKSPTIVYPAKGGV